MIKKCNICGHVGELTWRDGKYYCAMCCSEVSETDPQYTAPAPAQPSVPAYNVVCPICKNNKGNTPSGSQYRCALCGTIFDAGQQYQYASPVNNGTAYGSYDYNKAQRLQELHKEKDKKTLWGIVSLFLFWPAAIYFFYKANQINKQINQLQY